MEYAQQYMAASPNMDTATSPEQQIMALTKHLIDIMLILVILYKDHKQELYLMLWIMQNKTKIISLSQAFLKKTL